MIQKLIKKYTEILNTLEKNNSIKDTTDYYPYSIDIENTNEFLNDLKDLANYTHSSLELKEKYTQEFELPDTKEIESRLKHVVDESFEDYEVVEKREYSLGFRACFNWLKIKQMKSKGN